jgi:hypothetical protein
MVGGCRGTASACPAGTGHRRVSHATGTVGGAGSLHHDRPHPLCHGIRPERPAQLIPPSRAECSHRHGDGRRSIDTSARCPPGRQLNEWPGPVSCPRPRHGGAAGVDRLDTVQCVRIGDAVRTDRRSGHRPRRGYQRRTSVALRVKIVMSGVSPAKRAIPPTAHFEQRGGLHTAGHDP